MTNCFCRNFGPYEHREVDPYCPSHGWRHGSQATDVRDPWPHSHADDPRLDGGTAHSPGDSNGADNLFVRCHDCEGRGCDSCGETGFDWMDTEQARATVRMVCGGERDEQLEAMERERDKWFGLVCVLRGLLADADSNQEGERE